MKTTLLVLILALACPFSLSATSRITFGFAYQNETVDQDTGSIFTFDSIGAEITGLLGNKVGFLSDLGVQVPVLITQKPKL